MSSSVQLWNTTPLIQSNTHSYAHFKLEHLHPSYSFKYRGISHFIQVKQHGPSTHCIIASGGNAGLAAACVANRLGLKCTIYVPKGASQSLLDVFRRENSEVVVYGDAYADALKEAQKAAASDSDGLLVPAYEDPLVWEGHSSMVDEIADKITSKPQAICCSVGGAGLLGGIIQGCIKAGWSDIPIIAVETEGASCFYHSISLNPGKWNATEKILPDYFDPVPIYDDASQVWLARQIDFPSAASTSLGASTPAAGVVRMALDRPGPVICVNIPDDLCRQTALRFAQTQKTLVELACAASLSSAFKPSLIRKVLSSEELKTVVFIACGGFKISVEDLIPYQSFDSAHSDHRRHHLEHPGSEDPWNVLVDGRLIEVSKSE